MKSAKILFKEKQAVLTLSGKFDEKAVKEALKKVNFGGGDIVKQKK